MMRKCLNEKAATMVEFAIGIVLFFSIISVIFDFGIWFSKHSHLTYATNLIARTAAGQERVSNCNELRAAACARKQFIASRFGFAVDWADFELNVLPRGLPGNATADTCSVVVSGTEPVSCIFCVLIPNGATLAVSSQQTLEDFEGCNTMDAGCPLPPDNEVCD